MKRISILIILLSLLLPTITACSNISTPPQQKTTLTSKPINQTQTPSSPIQSTPHLTMTTSTLSTATIPTSTQTFTPTSSTLLTSTLTFTSTPPINPVTNVKITKIFYDGLVPRTESDEYVEITNLGNEPVDLKGWVLKDISEGYPSFKFPSYVLQAGKSIRVYTNEIHSKYGGFSFGSGKAVWNNSDPDTAALYNAQGQEVSRKSY